MISQVCNKLVAHSCSGAPAISRTAQPSTPCCTSRHARCKSSIRFLLALRASRRVRRDCSVSLGCSLPGMSAPRCPLTRANSRLRGICVSLSLMLENLQFDVGFDRAAPRQWKSAEPQIEATFDSAWYCYSRRQPDMSHLKLFSREIMKEYYRPVFVARGSEYSVLLEDSTI